jgi:UDP-glucose 4-epimerase
MADHSQVKKVLITGGAGFIGSHIADECVKRTWEVTILDNLSTGRIQNIQHLIQPQNINNQTSNTCEFVQGSITDPSLLQKLLKGVDYVFHQAAIASSVDDPLGSHEVNVTGSLNVLLAARDNHIKKVVCASSSAIYGNVPTLPKNEDMTVDPQSPYAVNKLSMEYYAGIFNKLYHLPTVCLRYFNVYGPRQNPSSEYAAVIPNFIQRIQHNQNLVIFGDGRQTRDFVAVQDVAKVNLLAAETDATGVYNIGSGEKISLNKLVEILSLITGRTDLKAIYDDPRPGDITHSLADISKAKSMGYNPYYTLTQGLCALMGIKLT